MPTRRTENKIKVTHSPPRNRPPIGRSHKSESGIESARRMPLVSRLRVITRVIETSAVVIISLDFTLSGTRYVSMTFRGTWTASPLPLLFCFAGVNSGRLPFAV